MKKNLIIIFILSVLFIAINIWLLPNIDYTKIEYVEYSMSESFSTDSEEEVVDVTPNTITVQLSLDYSFNGNETESEFDRSYIHTNQLDQTKKLKQELRAEAKEYHKGKNNEIMNSIQATIYQDIYISSYAPFIDITYDLEYFNRHKNDILEELTSNKEVKNVSVMESYNHYDNLILDTVYRVGAEPVYESRSKTGSGVIVGLLEKGIVDLDHPNLQNSLIEIRPHALNVIKSKEHATQMALIICGDNGIAPDVLVYNAGIYGVTITAEMEWLLDNDVDIINMSFGYLLSEGTYNSMSAYVDYIISQNYVVVVAAAGNEGEYDARICNPGLAYNAITVGATDCTDTMADYSSYIVDEGPIKPTIAMRGGIGLYDNDDTTIQGTSCSAALTTGFLSWIIEQRPSLIINKEQLLALMCANAYDPIYDDIPLANGFSNPLGAGIFNYGNMIDNLSNSGMTYYSGTYPLGTTIFTKTVYLTKNQSIRAAIATIASSDGTVDGISFTDYDLFIKSSTGEILNFSYSEDSVIEVVDWKATMNGNYTIEIVVASDRVKSRDYIGYAYRIY